MNKNAFVNTTTRHTRHRQSPDVSRETSRSLQGLTTKK